MHHPPNVGEAALDGLGVVAEGAHLRQGALGQAVEQVRGEQLVERGGHGSKRTPRTGISR